MARTFVDLADALAGDIEAGHGAAPKDFMRASRLRTALDVVADGLVAPAAAQEAYGVEFTADELAEAERLWGNARNGGRAE